MNKLVSNRPNGEFYTTSLLIGEAFSGSTKKHRNIMIAINRVIEEFDSIEEGLVHVPPIVEYHSNVSNATFTKTTYISKQKKTLPMYELNRQAYMLLIMQLSRFKKAREAQELFIQAFDLMEQRLKLSISTELTILKEIVPYDQINKKSVVNGECRDKLVRSYYRSTDGKTIRELDIAIAQLREKLNSLFSNKDELNEEIAVLENKRTLLIESKEEI